MTWGLPAATAAAVAVLALAACSTTDASAGELDSAASGVTGASTTAGDGHTTEGDGDPTTAAEGDTGEDDPTLDLGGQPSATCDPWAQDCPPEQKCSWERVDGVAKTRCVPVEPEPKQPGEPCTMFGDPGSGYDDCVLGALCTHLDERNQGVCMALCAGSPVEPSCPQEFAVCQVCPDCASLCLPLCDPLAQDCDLGFACTANAGSFACQPDAQTGMGGLGDPCEYAFQCLPGFACVDPAKVPGCNGAGCCSPFCSLGDPGCPTGLGCVQWYDRDDPPLPDLGICQAPQP